LAVDRPDGSSDEVDLPVYSLSDVPVEWLTQAAEPPREERDAMGRLGLELHRDFYWTPVALDGDQQLVVPAGQMQIRPASFRDHRWKGF
jgi:hypothetical protein